MKKCSYCGGESEDTLTMCRECGTSLPEESYQSKPPRILPASELRTRKRALLAAVFEAVFAAGVLVVGWLYPVWSIGRDPTMRHDTDTRLGPAFLFSIIVGFIFAVLAARSVRRALSRQ
jgi:hypothetical protein